MASLLKRFAFAIAFSAFGALYTAQAVAETASVDDLLRTASSGSADERYAAIDDLGERHEAAEKVVPKLTKMLSDDDPKIRWRSARSLGDYGEDAKPAAEALQKLLKNGDPMGQYHAAVALGKIGDSSDSTVDALVAAVTVPDGQVARAAISALRSLELDPQRVVAVLDKVLQSNDRVVVAHAIEAAVERGAKAVPVLNEALKRPNTAYIACAAIEHIGPEAAGTVPALTELLAATKHSQLTIESLLALASIGPAAKPATPQIIPLLDHSTDATVPVAAAYALGSIGATEADAALRRAAGRPNEMLQMVAAWALATLHPNDAELKQQALEKLRAGLQSNDPAIHAAAEKGLTLLETPAKEAGSQ